MTKRLPDPTYLLKKLLFLAESLRRAQRQARTGKNVPYRNVAQRRDLGQRTTPAPPVVQKILRLQTDARNL
jgi:hypothetical protein